MIVTLIVALDLLAVACFAFSGALAAARKEMDAFGVILIACISGVGGGTLRDVLVGRTPVFWVEHPSFLLAGVAGAMVVIVFGDRMPSRIRALVWADAAGLAFAAALGVELAWNAEAHWFVVILMGVMTGTFGGLTRDVICNEIPLLLRPVEIYALAAMGGATLQVALLAADMRPLYAACFGLALTFAIRAAAIKLDWKLPRARAPHPWNEEEDAS